MAYTEINFPSAKALKKAFKEGEVIRVFQPGPFGPKVEDGLAIIEGPHYPKPHSFYLSVEVKDGKIVKIKR